MCHNIQSHHDQHIFTFVQKELSYDTIDLNKEN